MTRSDDTSPETPESKRRISIIGLRPIVELFRHIIYRLNLIDRTQAYLLHKVDKSDPELLYSKRSEIANESQSKMNEIIESFEEAENEERPSQVDINVNVGNPNSKRPTILPKKTQNIILIIVTIIATVFTILRESGVIK